MAHVHVDQNLLIKNAFILKICAIYLQISRIKVPYHSLAKKFKMWLANSIIFQALTFHPLYQNG